MTIGALTAARLADIRQGGNYTMEEHRALLDAADLAADLAARLDDATRRVAQLEAALRETWTNIGLVRHLIAEYGDIDAMLLARVDERLCFEVKRLRAFFAKEPA
jgi:hypothetical protein